MRRSLRPLAPLAAVVALLVGCATPGSGGDDPASPDPAGPTGPAASGLVTGYPTVLQRDDEEPQLCFVVRESSPPQCSGPPIDGWDWDAVDDEESASGVTWGQYAVTGGWDGARFALASATSLGGIHDVQPIHPLEHPSRAGDTPEDELLGIQERLHAEQPFEILSSWPANGYLFVKVIYDDGTIQQRVDAEFGAHRVVIDGALQDV